MSQQTIDLLKKGMEANNNDSFRQNNVICLPEKGRLIAGGDIHGHNRNLQRIINFADLDNNSDIHVLLQEIIHGSELDEKGRCLSYKTLLNAIEYKIRFPDKVHLIMGNHDTAFINNSEVMKDGKEMNVSMRKAMNHEFGEDSENVKLAMRQFLFSEPLAIKCANRIWLSHSLPADRYFEDFDEQIFNRTLKINDVVRPGSAYLLTWGRRHSRQLLDKMAKKLDIDFFILGHQPQSRGWKQVGDNLIIIASDHNHGCLMDIDLAKRYSIAQLTESIIPLASIS